MYRPSVSIVSEHAPWCSTARDVVVEVAVGEAREELVLVEVVGDLAVDEIARTCRRARRLSTAMMRVSPRALSAWTRLEPMKPAAPVTTMYTVGSRVGV